MVQGRGKSDFTILGPVMASGEEVLQAVDALYFLPDNFKLVLTGSERADRSLHERLILLVRHYGVSGRVQFVQTDPDADAVILPNIGKTRSSNSVAGDSPEALASAILAVARTRAA